MHYILIIITYLIHKTCRFVHLRQSDSREHNQVYAHWHGEEFLMISAFLNRPMGIMLSRSKDGELVSKFLSFFNFKIVRGSSSRGGGSALKGLIDIVNDGYNASLAVDGPRGPVFKVKPGIVKLAQETGRPIVYGASAAKYRITFKKAWNKGFVPLPFSKCVLVYNKPLYISKEATKEDLEFYRQKIEREMLLSKKEAEEYFGRRFDIESGNTSDLKSLTFQEIQNP